MNAPSDTGSSRVPNVFVELIVIFDVGFVVKVKLFRVENNLLFGILRILPSRFQNRFEVLTRECCYVVRLGADNLFNEIL